MTRRFLPFSFLLAGLLATGSCGPASDPQQTESLTEALVRAEADGWEPGSWQLLEFSPEADLRVFGLPLSAPERVTVRALYHAVLVDRVGDSRRFPVDGPVQDVRIHAGTRKIIAVLDAGGTLHLWDVQTAQTASLAEHVFPGFSFSPDGRFLAYTAGLVPEMNLYRIQVDTREVLQLTHEDGPVWGPAFSPDGKEIAFVSSTGGYPSLAVIPAGGGATRRLTNVDLPEDGSPVHSSRLAPFPDGRRPPVWASDGLFFENSTGIHQITANGAQAGHWPGDSFPVLLHDRVLCIRERRLTPLGASPEVGK